MCVVMCEWKCASPSLVNVRVVRFASTTPECASASLNNVRVVWSEWYNVRVLNVRCIVRVLVWCASA